LSACTAREGVGDRVDDLVERVARPIPEIIGSAVLPVLFDVVEFGAAGGRTRNVTDGGTSSSSVMCQPA
jgi:hypothetical protein